MRLLPDRVWGKWELVNEFLLYYVIFRRFTFLFLGKKWKTMPWPAAGMSLTILWLAKIKLFHAMNFAKFCVNFQMYEMFPTIRIRPNHA